MPKKVYDAEFNPEILEILKSRDILGRAHVPNLGPLWYNLYTKVELMEKQFQKARKSNPLLETTPPEAWITTQIIPFIREIRPLAQVDEDVLSFALQRFLRQKARAQLTVHSSGKQKRRPHEPLMDGPTHEQKLYTTIEPYLAKLKNLLVDLTNRQKSLRTILRLPHNACTVREALTPKKPGKKRGEIFLQGIREQWHNSRIAAELDRQGLKPRSYKSYREMFQLSPNLFYSVKSDLKRKFLPD